MELLGTVKLTPGQVAFFDPKTKMHLTVASPFGRIYNGMNTVNIQRSVRSGRLMLVSGSFQHKEQEIKQELRGTTTSQIIIDEMSKAPEVLQPVQPKVVVEVVADPPVVEPIVEPVVEQTAEPIIEPVVEPVVEQQIAEPVVESSDEKDQKKGRGRKQNKKEGEE